MSTAAVPTPRGGGGGGGGGLAPVPVRPREPLWATLRRIRRLAPEFTAGLPVTLALAAVATAGRVVIPIAVQQTVDRGLLDGRPDLSVVRHAVVGAAVAIMVAALAAYRMNVRLYRMSEAVLVTMRIRAFRHIHDLSMLTQSEQRRGAVTSRVTSDVDQMSQFLQFGGMVLLLSTGQMLIATVLMAVYSWPLTVVVYACFIPMAVVVRRFQPRLTRQYLTVRERVGDMLGAISESVVGAAVVRAYGVQARTATRVDTSVDRYRSAQTAAQRLVATVFSAGELVAAGATGAVVVAGVLLGVGGHVSAGKLVAFLFLVTLFVVPLQTLTEMLNEGANAFAGLRRVLDVLDTPQDVPDPGPGGRDLPRGPLTVCFDGVSFAYPGGPLVLHAVDLRIAPGSRVAVVGETGSGKTTLAKLLVRLMDPTAGQVLFAGVPLDRVRFASLRRRVVMVPQDGFLFDVSIADNVRYGRLDATDSDVMDAFAALGLADWITGLADGVLTRVGERGSSLAAGERQLVALARAQIAAPDLLVLDEATSAVDPATEVRLARALGELTRGRTSVTIAHRLSTAESADMVVVVDAGRIVQQGTHAELVGVPGVYQRLHTSWTAGVTGS
ncbi:ABC transporter ATP-binding protein [Candidatus Protofrankia californiensis]|uniref:ABC transporter ATP-binding protein n=1 Tax=Candidatus Protofrankia californiensis TaxID=1839754 RepID=UPI00104173B1|nr:ABC transporter ATP-binding protein [Candidatus Protofrankia californiensis]